MKFAVNLIQEKLVQDKVQLAEKRIVMSSRQITEHAKRNAFKSETLMQMSNPKKMEYQPLFR